MERDGDLLLNVSCSKNEPGQHGLNKKPVPQRMPDGTKIANNRNLTRKIVKTHQPALSSGKVFIPKHKLPVLDEFGLTTPSDVVVDKKSAKKRSHSPDQSSEGSDGSDPDEDTSVNKQVRAKKQRKEKPSGRNRKRPDDDSDEDRDEDDDGDEEKEKSRRRKFKPGLNPRRQEKAENVFSEDKLSDLEDIHPYLVQNLEQNFNIERLTKIQSLVLPQLLKTRFQPNKKFEFLINSGIGSGKILSYVIPIVNNLALMEPRIDRRAGIYALVLLPTRELATTVSDVFSKLCRSFLWVVPGLLTGGERKKSEKARLRKGLNILITTPGRLIDHIEHSRSLEFNKMRYCVMADTHKLLDPERAEVSAKIALALRKKLPQNCVRCVVTATVTKKLSKFIKLFVSDPIEIDAFKQFE